jgi:hypothetical protein
MTGKVTDLIRHLSRLLAGIRPTAACGFFDAAPDETWLDVLARAGATPRAVPAWRAPLGRWLGASTLDPRGTVARSPAAT